MTKIRGTRWGFSAALLLALGTLAAGQGRSQAEVALQAAIRAETVDGNLSDAIRQFGRVAATYKSNRAVAASALVHMAECYQKMGDEQAQRVWERIVREFGDQADAASTARARLSDLPRPANPGSVVLRKLWSDPNIDWFRGGISPDGRYLTYAGAYNTSLVLRDLHAGSERTLAGEGLNAGNGTSSSSVSRNGREVAYNWCHAGMCELRVVPLTGQAPQARTVLANGQIDDIVPHDWSADGRIAVAIRLKDHTAQIGWVAVADGALHVLKSVEWRWPTRMFFSPDGLDIAYDLPGDDTNRRDVFVIASDGSRNVAAVSSPADDMLIGWSPDGRRLLFGSDRSGRMDLWSVGFTNRRPGGLPTLLKPDIGDIYPLGITASGSLYATAALFDEDIEVATIDLTSGQQVEPASRPIERFIGANTQPTWSPDGRSLAYVSIRGEGRALGSAGGQMASVVSIRSLDSRETRDVEPALSYWRSMTWTPDGTSFLVAGGDRHGRDGIYLIDARNGALRIVVAPLETREMPANEGFSWSSDGKRFYYRARNGSVHERELASGDDHVINTDANLGPISVSRDGRWIASTRRSGNASQLVLIPISGGEPRVLLSVDGPMQQFRGLVWAADGRAVLVRKALNAEETSSELWQVPVDGSAPRKLDVDVNRAFGGGVGRMALHPDGRRLAMVAGHYPINELWVLEHFLPATPASSR